MIEEVEENQNSIKISKSKEIKSFIDIQGLTESFYFEEIPDYYFRTDEDEVGLFLERNQGVKRNYILVEKSSGRLWLAEERKEGGIFCRLAHLFHGIRQGEKGLGILKRQGKLLSKNYEEVYMGVPSVVLKYAKKVVDRLFGNKDEIILEVIPRGRLKKRTQFQSLGLRIAEIGDLGTRPLDFISGYNEYLVDAVSIEELSKVHVITKGDVEARKNYYEKKYPDMTFKIYKSENDFLKQAFL